MTRRTAVPRAPARRRPPNARAWLLAVRARRARPGGARARCSAASSGAERRVAPPPVPRRARRRRRPRARLAASAAARPRAPERSCAALGRRSRRSTPRRFRGAHRRRTSPRAGWKASTRSTPTAQRTFGVNWLLLASIHMQESAFSTAPGHLPRAQLRPLLRRADAVQRDERTASPRGTWSATPTSTAARPAALRPHDRQAPVDLRRLRLDHGRRAPALRRRRRLRARRLGLGRRLRLLRPRRHRRALRRPGARARDRLVPARLLHQLRRRQRSMVDAVARRLRRPGAGGAARTPRAGARGRRGAPAPQAAAR